MKTRLLLFGLAFCFASLRAMSAEDEIPSTPAAAQAGEAAEAKGATDAKDAPAATDVAAEKQAAAPGEEPQKYLLRYQFRPSEVLRWKVVHQALVRTTVGGTTQTAETHSESVKVWQVKEVDKEADLATFVHSVEKVEMRQAVSGRAEVRYNSATDAAAPAEFEEVAKSVGVPLSIIELDSRGHVTKRHEERAKPSGAGEMTVPLPEQAVAVGENWAFPHDASVRQKDGTVKQVKTRQQFTFVGVENGVATIKIETVVLTPIRDPALETQLIQHVTDGTVRFDIAAGRVIGQQTDIDKRVVGFQGETSSMHYLTRFTEELIPPAPATAANDKKKDERAATKSAEKTGTAAKVATKPGTTAPATKTNPAPGNSSRKTAGVPNNPPANKPAAGKTTGKTAAKQQPAQQQKTKTGNKPKSNQQR